LSEAAARFKPAGDRATLRDGDPALLAPPRIRRRILDEHTRIAGWLAELEHLAGRLRRGEEDLVPELRRRGEGLRAFFLSHLALEERILAPALECAGGPGPARARRLVAEHEAQRALVARFAGDLSAGCASPLALAEAVEAFVRTVRADMRAEEELELDPALLVEPEL
jgi:hypothetical protein